MLRMVIDIIRASSSIPGLDCSGTRCLQCFFYISMPPLQVGFEVVAFGPFVPGVDEHDWFGEAVEGRAVGQHSVKPLAIGGWG